MCIIILRYSIIVRMRGNVMLENKLGITDSAELARIEEKISKQKAVEMF